jgi:hypothetical protein
MCSRPRIALVCSAHGLGHLTRQLALAEALGAEGAVPVVFTAAPVLARAYLPWLETIPWAVDVGLAPSDSPRGELPATLALLEERCGERALGRLAAALDGFDLAVVDIAPVALEACRRAGLPALAMGNFDWAWIYGHYPQLRGWAERFERWQAPHPALELSPGPGLRGFAAVEPWGLLGRRRAPWRAPRGARTVLIGLGGAGLQGLVGRLPRVDGLRWVFALPAKPPDRSDCLQAPALPFPALVAGVDLILSKPGYGIFAECALAGRPLVWVERPGFPEAPSLEAAMRARGDRAIGASLEDATGFGEALARAVQARLASPRPAPVEGVEPRRLARRVLEAAAR